MSAFFLAILSHQFSKIYGRDIQSNQDQVEEFFDKMARPIEVEKEVYSSGAKEINVFPLVGSTAMIIAGISALLLMLPGARMKIAANLAFSGLLFFFGILAFVSKYVSKIGNSKNE
jgi:hypothetical protein